MKKMEEIKKFGIFKEYHERDNFVYLSIDSGDFGISSDLFQKLFNFFFSEDVLFEHYKINNDCLYEKSTANISLLYRNLKKFIDEEAFEVEYNYDDCDEDVVEIVKDEIAFFEEFSIRRDKIGKIGEYLMAIILEKIFEYVCIIPKSNLTTSYNMSVYGIDNLHYIPNENVILFGESKFTSSLSKGITLVSKSLEKYEHQIKQEIELIFTQDKINQLRLPMSLYKDAIENFIDIETFIKKSDIHQLIVPLFIAHGVETSPQKIIEQLKKINRHQFLGMETKYIVISMPVINAVDFIKATSLHLSMLIREYEERIKGSI